MPTWVWVVGGLGLVLLVMVFGPGLLYRITLKTGPLVPVRPVVVHEETPEVRVARLEYEEAKRQRRALREQERKLRGES